jgi:hypothetical protein
MNGKGRGDSVVHEMEMTSRPRVHRGRGANEAANRTSGWGVAQRSQTLKDCSDEVAFTRALLVPLPCLGISSRSAGMVTHAAPFSSPQDLLAELEHRNIRLHEKVTETLVHQRYKVLAPSSTNTLATLGGARGSGCRTHCIPSTQLHPHASASHTPKSAHHPTRPLFLKCMPPPSPPEMHDLRSLVDHSARAHRQWCTRHVISALVRMWLSKSSSGMMI